MCVLIGGDSLFKEEDFSTLVWKTLYSMVSEQRLLAFNIWQISLETGCKIAW